MALPLPIIMGWRVRSWALVSVINSLKKNLLDILGLWIYQKRTNPAIAKANVLSIYQPQALFLQAKSL